MIPLPRKKASYGMNKMSQKKKKKNKGDGSYSERVRAK